MHQDVDTVEKLNIALKSMFKTYSIEEYFCEITEAEVGTLLPDIAKRMG
jgi:hypothetical protein